MPRDCFVVVVCGVCFACVLGSSQGYSKKEQLSLVGSYCYFPPLETEKLYDKLIPPTSH